jgi:hypothetical protein
MGKIEQRSPLGMIQKGDRVKRIPGRRLRR